MLRKIILLTICLAAVLCTDAQVKRKIKKGRRNKSQSDFALDQGDVEVDWEFGYETVTPDIHTFVYPNLALRYGITDRLEVNTEFSLLSAWDRSVSPKSHISGLEPASFGINYQIMDEGPKRPSLIFSAQLAIPYFASAHFTADRYAPMLELIANMPVHKDHVFGTSAGLFWDGFSSHPSFIYNGNYTYHLDKKWDIGAELFGFVNNGPDQHNADLSLTYNLTKDISFGATGGIGLTSTSHRSYIAVSGVWGMNTLKKKN
jgi:hypothetical protein